MLVYIRASTVGETRATTNVRDEMLMRLIFYAKIVFSQRSARRACVAYALCPYGLVLGAQTLRQSLRDARVR